MSFHHNTAIDTVNIYVQATNVQDQTSLCPQTDLHHLKLALEYLLLVFVCLYCKQRLSLCLEDGKEMNLNEQAVGGVFVSATTRHYSGLVCNLICNLSNQYGVLIANSKVT